MRFARGLFVFLFFILLTQGVYAFSNESVNAKIEIDKIEVGMAELQSRDIPVNRINESYQEVLQLYSAQMALEASRKSGDYDLIMEYVLEIEKIKEDALRADDELEIFLETYDSIGKESDLSEMDEEYSEVIVSFSDERFEDTLELINSGYSRISEIQSSQTAMNLFYSTASKSIDDFVKDNWIIIIIISIGGAVVLFVFDKSISAWMTRRRLHHLTVKRESVNRLIKGLQKEYFKTKSISGLEYKTKLKTFNDMILEINRQVPLLKAEIIRSGRKSR